MLITDLCRRALEMDVNPAALLKTIRALNAVRHRGRSIVRNGRHLGEARTDGSHNECEADGAAHDCALAPEKQTWWFFPGWVQL